MHEASLMTDLMRRIQQIAAAERASRVVAVDVWLGALCHMSREHFAEHFEHASKGTVAEGAKLNVTVSDDTSCPEAQDIRLESVQVET